MGTSDQRAAVNGLIPSTDWRYCVVKTASPTIANIDTSPIMTEPVNPRLRNSFRSIMGEEPRACRRMNATPVAAPIAIHAARAGSARTAGTVLHAVFIGVMVKWFMDPEQALSAHELADGMRIIAEHMTAGQP